MSKLDHTSELHQNWLGLLCKMIPGSSQAVLLPEADAQDDALLRWPEDSALYEETLSTARLASSQGKSVTTTLSSAPRSDENAEMVIALPLTRTNPGASLAVLVNIKPSQQSVVMQILRWGEDWLELLAQGQNGELTKIDAAAKNPRARRLPTIRFRLVALGMALLLVMAAFTPGAHRVTASANIEGKVQRAIVAPFDGYIAGAYARAGETVAAGEVLAELDVEDLHLQQARLGAEMNEHERQYRKALAARDQTQAHIFKSQVRQAEAQLTLIEKKIERAALKSALDGVIISGDLSRSLDAPVTTGEVLFEVAPLDEYRLIIHVDEKQVASIEEGLAGALSLKALPGDSLPFVVHRMSPVYQADSNGIAYRVEARLSEHNPTLRPGMEGVAKIEIGRRSLLWIYTHELLDVIRLWVWRWLP